MKKIFTLLFAAGIFIAADAQPRVRTQRSPVGVHVNVGNNGYRNSSFAADRRLREEVARVNMKYDRQVYQVRNSMFMRPAKKAKKIRAIELQRNREINRVYQRFGKNSRYGTTSRRY